jgi:predicted Ser/Thr protein kinase
MGTEPHSRGPYRVSSLLGRGTMGAVYRAEHATSGRLVALKIVKVPWASLLPMVRREIRALERLHHPGVVRILDSGAEAGVPWYAMELIEGPTLRQWASAQEPRAPSEVLSLLRRLCRALAYVHGEGIVHRDLKPENVLLRADGQPVLVDFGVLAAFGGADGRETLSVEAGPAGTPLYMAPEQLRGELVDARADLYALGCVMYELFGGEPPFTGTPQQVREAQLHVEPRALADLAPWAPAELSELVSRLLRKEPRKRLGYASDVAAVLERLGAKAGSTEGPEPKAYLYRPGLVGRKEPLHVLEAHLEVLDEGRGGLLLIGGESGVGKTRLLVELARRAAARRVRVLAGECVPEAGGALEALRKPLQALGDWCRQQGVEETRQVLGPHGKLLGRFEASLLELEGLKEAPEPAELPPEAARLRLFGTLTEVFGSWARHRRLLLALDDLQWADDLTLSFLEHLLRSAAEGAAEALPLLVVGTYRTEEAGQGLRRLLGTPETRHMTLGRLEAAAMGSMVRDMLALGQPAPAFERFVARQTEGNPLFAGEYLRTAVAEGVLYRDAQGRWQVAEPGEEQASEAVFEALPLPGALRGLLARRLRGLEPAARKLAEAVSVLGREAEETLLGRMVGGSAAKRLDAARQLLTRQVLEDTAAGRLRFSHDKLREVAY